MMYTLYEKVENEKRRLETKISSLRRELCHYPPGKLQCVQEGKFQRWYLNETGKRTYISKKNRRLAEELAAKKYLSSVLKSLEQERKAAEFYLRHHKTDQSEEYLKPTSPYYKLLKPYFCLQSEEMQKWVDEDYERNEKYPEQLIYRASSGKCVRSKSEMLIDTFLHINKIPFRYECALVLNEITIYPDFTIKHPESGEVFYWEHFGMMDDPNYSKNVWSKIQLYTAHGIIPSINLITTFETREHPLSSEMIEQTIAYYFK